MAQSEETAVWTGLFKQISNSPDFVGSYQTQQAVLNDLFPPQPKNDPYSLVDWYMHNRENDLILYYAFGFLHPTEREFLYHHMVRWANGLIKAEQANLDPSEIRPDGTATVYVPRPTVSRFFQDWAQDNFVAHENLFLRLEPAIKMITRLDSALHNEGTRQSPDEWVSALDELMCQDVYPQDEKLCWYWMNKMAAPHEKTLFSMDMSETQNALKELNLFRINCVMADYRDFAQQPIVTQRVNGKLKHSVLPWISAKILANQKFLDSNGLIDNKKINSIKKMSPQKRAETELILEKNAIVAFLEDLAQAAPSREWLVKMEQKFERYFHPILEKVGYPVMQFEISELKDKKGNPQTWQVMYVSFNPEKTPISQRISHNLER